MLRPSISSYQEKDAFAHTCKNQFSHVSIISIFILKTQNFSALSSVRFSWGGGQVAQARIASSPWGGGGGQAAQRQLHPRGGQAAQGGGQDTPGYPSPWGKLPRQLQPRGASCPGCKINRYTGTWSNLGVKK